MKKKKMNGYLLAGLIITTVIIVWIIIGRFYTPYNPTKMSSAASCRDRERPWSLRRLPS